jgi:4-hydroxybenzoate polyprenyltransferase
VLVVGLSLVGLAVLFQMKPAAQIMALLSLVPVAAYPFMKRITWWPQAWLGLVFSWGALVGWPAVTGSFEAPALILWAGSIFWVIGYDTLYAIQDIEDDALVGVKSSARALGARARMGVGICYALAVAGWGAAIWSVRPDWVALLALVPAAIHLTIQVARTNPNDGPGALALFRSNRFTGLLLFLGFLAVGLSSFD